MSAFDPLQTLLAPMRSLQRLTAFDRALAMGLKGDQRAQVLAARARAAGTVVDYAN